MSLDTSINNVGEYDSSHYLTSTFSKDVKSLVAQWRKQGSNTVPRRVQQLSHLYFRAKTQALEEELPEDRWRAGDDLAAWYARLLENMGYIDRKPLDIPVEGAKTFVPACGPHQPLQPAQAGHLRNRLLPAGNQLERRKTQRRPAGDAAVIKGADQVNWLNWFSQKMSNIRTLKHNF